MTYLLVSTMIIAPVVRGQAITQAERDSLMSARFKADPKFAPFAMAGPNQLGDSASVATLDSAAQVGVYSSAVNAARKSDSTWIEQSENGRIRGQPWLMRDLLGHAASGLGGPNIDTTASVDPGVLNAVVVSAGLAGVCRQHSRTCLSVESGASTFVLSRIYRIDSGSVRAFVLILDPLTNWSLRTTGGLERSRLEVYRIERRDHGWVTVARQRLWIVD